MLRILVVLGLSAMLTNQAYHDRIADRLVDEDISGADRFVDASVMLHIVKADPNGKEILPGKPRMVEVRPPTPHGGMIDTKTMPPQITWSADCKPRDWYCSEDQAAVLLHGRGKPHKQLVYGSEGAGKTRLLVMWHYFRWLDYLGEGREGGQTAPTLGRLGLVKQEMLDAFGPNWCRYVARDDFEGFEMCDRTRIRFRYAHQQSAAKGAPIQGYNWAWWAGDEMQDQVEAYEDILSRGRSAPGGVYLQLGTATAKDSPAWRTLRDRLEASGLWVRRTLLGPRSPFVHPEHWESMKATMSKNEYLRRVLAQDVPRERLVYSSWQRDEQGRRLNVRPNPITGMPVLGARRITSLVLRRKTNDPAHSLLIGNDPGTAKAGSIFLDAYQLPGDPDPVWWVRAELFTLHESTEQHALKALEIARKFGCNHRRLINGRWEGAPEIAHVRSQPVGQSANKPDQDVYRIWSRVGFDIRAAQYTKDGTGTGHIAKDSRVEMVNRLLCDASGRRRLFVDCDEQGRPVAPKLVEAFEALERDEKGRAEHDEKDEHDLTDLPAALGYALWPFEKESAVNMRADVRRGLT